MTLEKVCKLAGKCKKAGSEVCNITCFPYILAHGSDGAGGFFAAANVPAKYRNMFLSDLQMIRGQNPTAYTIAKAYAANILDNVQEGTGFFFYSVPNKDNPKGTGTGKSTTAAVLVNEYVQARIIQHAKGDGKITVLPAVYMRVSEYQNTYNAQFRGTPEMQAEAAEKYYNMKQQMVETDLLVLDDIGLRDAKTLVNEIYEIIDLRNNENKATIFTSNLPIQKIGELLSEQIASRIEEMTEPVPFVGKDNRKKFM